MGCSLELYNRDNGLDQGIRDWQHVSVVLGNNMNELWSGFCAYAYDGNPLFDFMQVDPGMAYIHWNPHPTLIISWTNSMNFTKMVQW